MIGVKPEGADGGAVHVIGGAVDTPWLRAFAQAHEKAGFDRVLVGYTSTSAEGFAVTGYAAAHTERLGYLIAHRPGFVAPTLTARAAATLDHVTNGRVALHIITGGSDSEQTRDGDWLDHDTRYRRTDEYLSVLRRMWTAPEPFDHDGEFYRFAKAFSEVKPLQPGSIPLYFGGASGAAARGFRARGRGARQAPVDADRCGHGRRRQHHGAGRHPGAGGRVAARLLRHRLHDPAHPRLRSAQRRARVRPRAHPARARRGGPPRSRRRGGGVTSLLAVVGSVTPPGRLN